VKWLIRSAVEHPTAINVLMAALVIIGLALVRKIPRESFPKIERDRVDVRVRWPGHTPAEVEEATVIKIEEAVQAISGVDTVTSTCNHGSGRVRIELKKGADRRQALDDVRDGVALIANFPSDIEPVSIRASVSRQPAIAIALHGPIDARSMRTLAERVRDELLDQKEISLVEIEGLRQRELAIEVSPAKLRSLHLTLEDVHNAVRRANLEVNTGTLTTRAEDILVQAGERAYTAEQLERIAVKSVRRGAEILLRDVATVTERDTERTYTMRFNSERAAVIQVLKTEEEDMISIVSVVKEFVDGLHDRLPPGVSANLWRDRTIILHQRMDLLMTNGMIGLLLIFFALWLFTRLKLSLWVAAGLPVAVFGAAILLYNVDVTINMISLFGLLLVSGILVDDAIVVSENIYAYVEAGLSPREAAIKGTLEVMPAVSASIVTTIIAFIPFFFMGGHIGKFVQAIPIVVICCLILSWVESLIILPPHLAHSLDEVGDEAETWAGRMRARVDATVNLLLRRPYAALLRIILKLRWQMVAFGIALLFVTFGLGQGGFIKFIFFPNLDADDIQVEYLLEPGAPEAVNDAFARRVETAAEEASAELTPQQTGNKDVFRGRLTTIGGTQSEHGVVRVELLPGEERDAPSAQVARLWKEKLGPVPEARWMTAGSRRRGPFGKTVHIELLSNNQHDLEDAADKLKEKLSGYAATSDISDDLVIGKRQLVVQLLERGRAAGLTLRQVASQLRTGLFGGRVEVLQRGRDELEVWVRYPRADRNSVGQLADLRITTPAGDELAMRDIATWRWGRGLDTIKRFNRRRKVTVTADIDPVEGNPEHVLEDLKENVVPDLTAEYAGMAASFEGQSRERRKMIEGFRKALPWALFGMFAVLIVVFNSYAQATLVMLMIPLGLIGAVIGHMIIGIDLTILSVWGIVALGGIIVNDSIVFVDAINRRLVAGRPLLDAVHEAGVSRFRPILLTTLTTAAGLMPIILEQSRQAQFLIPMAASLAFGLLFGTVFTLGVLPAGFACINDARQFFRWLRKGTWPTPEELEPSIRRGAKTHA